MSFHFFPLCGHRAYKLFHSVCAVLFHLICHMSVHIQSKRGSCMNQIILHSFDIIAGLYGRNSVGVPQIVETSIGASDICYHLFEVTVYYLGAQMMS